MPDSARVVIIGGGIIGCSVAYHLTKMGWKDVVLLDKGELTSGSTWHAAGLVGQLRSDRNLTRMLQYSVFLYEQLEAETGLNTGWNPCGCLHLASTKERMYELKKGVTTARSFGLEMHIVSPKEAYDLCPILSLEGIIGAAFMPTDGQADPAGLTQAMAKGAKDRGAKVFQNTLVTGFEFAKKRVDVIKTSKGDIQCEILVNCTGMWGYQIGEMMGVNIPVVPFQHQFLVTDAIKGLPQYLPTVRDKDSLIYYKKEVDGLVMGGYERDGIPWSIGGVSNDFTSQLLEPDFDHFQTLSVPAMKRTPCLEDAGIVKLFNGPEAFTPDGNAIMGPAPEIDNCYVAVGFNAFGIAAGGGAGRMMAEWIVEGEPSLDIWPLDIRRFGPHHKSRSYNVERTREIYGKHYTIHWPYEEHDSVRGVRLSPLYTILKEKGAVFGAKYGWERANWFAPEGVDPKDKLTFEIPHWFEYVGNEHHAARESVVLIDQSSFAKFEISGSKALKYLNWLAANDIKKPVGSVTYSQLCNARGTVEADVTITRLKDDTFFIVTGTAFGLRDAEWIKRHMPKDGSVMFRDVTSAFAVINVIGPNSRRLLEKVAQDDVSHENFNFGECKTLTVGYTPVTALRITYVGELGYELYIPNEFACHAYEALWEAGQDLGVRNAGYRCVNSLHFEKGYCYWGAELTPEYTPYDAGLGFGVALNKADFLGRDALIKVKEKGPKWKLCSFTIDADDPVMVRGSEPIIHNGKVIGITTSGGFGYTIGKTIVYSYIPIAYANHTSGYEIEVYMEKFPITRHDNRSLYDPERKKILV
ncbi:MAG: FAD-dependent oxidoreductase [Desulfobacterales bacterium]|nr:MAG: FAD-dependent oxidoreductase [Desulfobacterales bacterium]